MLLNISVFAWFGATCPWVLFRVNDVIPIYRLVPLGIMILLFRRIPMVMGMWKHIHQIEDYQQALFVGFFGPIGVSAIFYLYVSLDFLNKITVDGEVREDVQHLEEVMTVVIWFLAICSIVVHGLSVPMGKLGYHLPRTVSQALSTSQENDDEPHVFLRHFSGDRGGQLRRRKQPERRPSAGAFELGGANSRVATDIQEQSAAEPPRPVRFPDSGPNTPRGPGTPMRQPSDDASNDADASADTANGFVTVKTQSEETAKSA